MDQAEKLKSPVQADKVRSPISTWSAPEKVSTPAINEAKYKDLLKDLESSVDILYEISRSRRALATGSHPTFSSDDYPHEYAPGTIVSGSSKRASSKERHIREDAAGALTQESRMHFQSFITAFAVLVTQASCLGFPRIPHFEASPAVVREDLAAHVPQQAYVPKCKSYLDRSLFRLKADNFSHVKPPRKLLRKRLIISATCFLI